MTETFVLYLFGPDGKHGGKNYYEGGKALVEAAREALKTGKYPEVRGTDMLDRLVLHIVDGGVRHPVGEPDTLSPLRWEIKHGFLKNLKEGE